MEKRTKQDCIRLLRMMVSGQMQLDREECEEALAFLEHGPEDPTHPEYVLSSVIWTTEDVLDAIEEQGMDVADLPGLICRVKAAFDQRELTASYDEGHSLIRAEIGGVV